MITKLVLNNFMRHENLDIEFSGGLQTLRGSNEAGKSSLLMGIAYALFGSKALRTTFGQAVTWGKPESSLKVVLGLRLGGRDITVTRSKGSAEIAEGGKPIVTGQSEVSSYLASLIGADVTAATRLMLANQGNLRGALEQGPKATAQMIEDLADFDLFERLIEAMTEKLALGSTDAVEDRVKISQEKLAGRSEPVRPDLSLIDADIAVMAAAISGVERETDELFKALGVAEVEVKRVESGLARVEALTSQVQSINQRRETLVTQGEALATAAQPPEDASSVPTLREAIAEAKNYAKVAVAWSKYVETAYPATYWEGTREEFADHLKGMQDLQRDLQTRHAAKQGDVRVLRSTLTTSSICGFCGKDFTSLPEIAEKNAKTQAAIDAAEVEVLALASQFDAVTKNLKTLSDLHSDAMRIEGVARSLVDYVTCDNNFWPLKMAWTWGELSPKTPDVKALEGQLADIERRIKESEAADAKLTVVKQSLADVTLELEKALSSLKALDEFTPEAVALATSKKDAAHAAWHEAYQKYSRALLAHSEAVQQRDSLARNYDVALSEWTTLNEALATDAAALESMRFNNTLLKKVRLARPLIADKLWNTVLAAVSTMFTQLRGEASVVAKGKEGFTVNGQAVDSLSGSTLDLLGLAIRVALVRTFIPYCPLLVLDEPFASADASRTAAMLAFIQSAGFNQVLLVTHEDLSGSIADNIIEL